MIHQNITFCLSVLKRTAKGTNAAWCMGYLAGVGRSGYRCPRLASDEVRTAYYEGKSSGSIERTRYEAAYGAL